MRPHACSILAVTVVVAACARSDGFPKLDRSSTLNLSAIARRYHVLHCKVSVPLSQDEVLRVVRSQGIPHPEDRQDWKEISKGIKPGDQLRQVICLTKGPTGVAAGDVFFGLFRDRKMISEMHTIIVD